MSYEKQTWQTGDIIAADKLNHMEDGIAGGYDIVFTKTTSIPSSVMTADGASFDELLNDGEKKAKLLNILMDSETPVAKSYIQSVNFEASQFASTSTILFVFVIAGESSKLCSITLDSNGDYSEMLTYFNGESEEITGTYTYSNGHYVFTPEESGD